jgi:rhamnosyltransferase
LGKQVSYIIVVDNASPAGRFAIIERAQRKHELRVIRLNENRGLGAAHNLGISRARELGASHALFLDQDSFPHADMVSALLSAEQTLLACGTKVGAVGPVFFDPRLSKAWPFFRISNLGVRPRWCRAQAHVECDLLITSGTLARMEVLGEVGGLKESYFIEHIDTEWSLRLRDRGYALFGVCAARMEHHLGDSAFRLPFTTRVIQVYQPYRLYYTFRNAMLLWREPYAPVPWKLNEVKRLAIRLLLFSLCVPPRWRRARYMFLGLWHGLLGRTGALDT